MADAETMRVFSAVLVASAGLSLVGCSAYRGGGSEVPEPPQDLYPPVIETPAEYDPFADPGVINTPPTHVPGGGAYLPQGGYTHTVARGETLWRIAQARLGSGHRWRDLAAANPGVDPHRLAVGQTLVLPQ